MAEQNLGIALVSNGSTVKDSCGCEGSGSTRGRVCTRRISIDSERRSRRGYRRVRPLKSAGQLIDCIGKRDSHPVVVVDIAVAYLYVKRVWGWMRFDEPIETPSKRLVPVS